MHMSFYAPREFFDAKRYAHAAYALQIARLVKPDDGGVCFWQARALAQLGDKGNALAALECAGASRQVSVEAIEADPLLAPLRSDPRYEAVVRRLKGGSRSGRRATDDGRRIACHPERSEGSRFSRSRAPLSVWLRSLAALGNDQTA